ncbi:MAG: hypothetical protein Ta2D_10470 [Rickettsiales bacterium]|nr:MAG: hypothetical protein Ta2D_10470 [Rickettsiales bacterium]
MDENVSKLDNNNDFLSKLPKIVVFGIGGGGCNAVNNIYQKNSNNIQLIAANTDLKSLISVKAHHKVQLGKNLVKGFGSGSDPDVGKAATEESADEIKELIKEANLLFITTGMGGGTGTGGAPVIAKIARQMGILTVAVVTKPFEHETKLKYERAEKGIAELEKYVNTLIVLPNDKLNTIANQETTMKDALIASDNVLYLGVTGIADLITQGGIITLDFNDVKMIIEKGGRAIMGTGEGVGEDRVLKAVQNALLNPLLETTDISLAKGILVNIIGGNDMTFFEYEEAAKKITEELKMQNAVTKVGTVLSNEMEGRIKVMIFAAGIEIKKEDREMPKVEVVAPTPIPAPAPIPAPIHAHIPVELPIVMPQPVQKPPVQENNEKGGLFNSLFGERKKEEVVAAAPPPPPKLTQRIDEISSLGITDIPDDELDLPPFLRGLKNK